MGDFPAQQPARFDHIKLEQGADVDASIRASYGYQLLVPTRCALDHGGHHHPQDILRHAAGARRWSFDPYAGRHLKVALDNSVPFGGADDQTPDWRIDFDPDSVECTTWDNVFHVRERIKRDVLDSSFWQWLRDFSAWFKKRMSIADPGDAEVLDAMRTYAEDLALTGLTAREFLRAPVFQMLHRHCKKPVISGFSH